MGIDLSRHFSVLVALLLMGCSTPASRAIRDAEKSPATVEIKSAGDFLLGLKERGELPGVSKNDHGDLQLNFTLPLPEKMEYPFTATFQITVRGQSFTNHYTIQRETKDSIWQLQRAWRTDSEGKIVEEWLGPSTPTMPTVFS